MSTGINTSNRGNKTSGPGEIYLNGVSDLDALIERIGNSHFVLLGEASHGTHEFYTWRMAITQRLIKEKGFNFIAVEGDWPDCYKINRYIKGYNNSGRSALDILNEFDRWPTWMWANWEIEILVKWLRNHNQTQPSGKKIGFYGLDVYSLWESMENIMNYLIKVDPKAAKFADAALQCFEPFQEQGDKYARALYTMKEGCRDEVVNLLLEIRRKSPTYDHDPEAAFNAEQNALIAVNAEKYYRSMSGLGEEGWNIRDRHMAETLDRLMHFHGNNAKCVVWEHNTHIGDARYTDMHKAGLVNIGELVREEQGEYDVVLVGFATYEGSVIAGAKWGDKIKKMHVPPAREGSLEYLLHQESDADRMILMDYPEQIKKYNAVIPHRAIGVVYNPEVERYGNYVPSQVSSRYDALIYLDKTTALHPLKIEPDGHKIPDTYPFGV